MFFFRVLNSNSNIKYCKYKTKPNLKKYHIEARKVLVKNHHIWDSKWKSGVFTDEKKFNLDGPDGLRYYWHDLRKEPKCLSMCTAGS